MVQGMGQKANGIANSKSLHAFPVAMSSAWPARRTQIFWTTNKILEIIIIHPSFQVALQRLA